jgi:hypothetical protein
MATRGSTFKLHKHYLSVQSSTNPIEPSTYRGVFFADLDIHTHAGRYHEFPYLTQNYLKKRFENHYHQHPICYTAFYDKYLLLLQNFTPLFRTVDYTVA